MTVLARARRVREALLGGRNQTWHATEALRRGLLLGVGLVVAGVLAHNVVLALLGAPLLAASVLALSTKPSGTPKVTVLPVARTGEAGETALATVRVDPGHGAELLAIRLPDKGNPGPGPVHLLPASVAEIACGLYRRAWGEGVDLRLDHLVAGPDALIVHGPMVGREVSRVLLPPVRELPAGPVPARPAGLVGVHRSRRPGDSTDLRTIRPFQPGDRMRRIDWRVSLRSNDSMPYVRENHAESDADVVLVLDTRFDVAAEIADWSLPARGAAVRPGGSLDTAVRAAASLAASYLRQGDRVGLVDLGRPRLYVRPGAGRRQLLRLRNQLVVCARSAGWSSRPVLNAHQVSGGALVVVLSPFLDDAVVGATAQAARRGNLVLAVDVLPAELVAEPEDRWGEPVRQIITLERRVRLDALRGHGIAVLPWSSAEQGLHVLRPGARRSR
ncbi:DUF58 domain-containing protein [Kutzneria albida]|uniref:DUF58 domain-containing protein n=1 Tax=Kutzneria albida DSM 43870 TaxID=1449976 RepID=W5W3W3_9PSEU|nr:DUF58 domain-containing protein [Kutzneria albida]AHH95923.1 hypothetical protein KALB_2555 [Kutzneria albida DSM 43870]